MSISTPFLYSFLSIVFESQIGSLIRIVDFGGAVAVRREIYLLVYGDRFAWGKTFLATLDRPAERSFQNCSRSRSSDRRAVQLIFENKDAFEKDDVDVVELVRVRAIFGRGLPGKIHCQINFAILFKWKDQRLEHFIKPKCVMIEVTRPLKRRSFLLEESDVREIQPSVDIDQCNPMTARFQTASSRFAT